MKKICVVVGSRANYSSIKSTIKAIQTHKKLKLILVLCASAVLDKYGSIEKQIKNDGFKVDESIFTLIDGGNPVTMAKSTGLGMIELTTVFKKKKPDIVITVGDRFETMSTKAEFKTGEFSSFSKDKGVFVFILKLVVFVTILSVLPFKI